MQQTNTRRPGEALLCGSVGGAVYYVIELTWRGHSHWTMALLGGVLFVILGGVGRRLGEQAPLWLQGALGGAVVTACELSAGIWINLVLGLNVWDYSRMPCNLLGQICLPYALLWAPLSAGAIRLDRLLRRALDGGPRGGKLTEHS